MGVEARGTEVMDKHGVKEGNVERQKGKDFAKRTDIIMGKIIFFIRRNRNTRDHISLGKVHIWIKSNARDALRKRLETLSW